MTQNELDQHFLLSIHFPTGKICYWLDLGASIEAKNQYGLSALSLCALDGKTENLKILLSRGAEIDTLSLENRAPLHYAAHNGYFDCVMALLEKGANPFIKDTRKMTAIDIATENGFSDIISILESAMDSNQLTSMINSDNQTESIEF